MHFKVIHAENLHNQGEALPPEYRCEYRSWLKTWNGDTGKALAEMNNPAVSRRKKRGPVKLPKVSKRSGIHPGSPPHQLSEDDVPTPLSGHDDFAGDAKPLVAGAALRSQGYENAGKSPVSALPFPEAHGSKERAPPDSRDSAPAAMFMGGAENTTTNNNSNNNSLPGTWEESAPQDSQRYGVSRQNNATQKMLRQREHGRLPSIPRPKRATFFSGSIHPNPSRKPLVEQREREKAHEKLIARDKRKALHQLDEIQVRLEHAKELQRTKKEAREQLQKEREEEIERELDEWEKNYVSDEDDDDENSKMEDGKEEEEKEKEKGGASDEKNYVSNEDDDTNENSKMEDGKEEEEKEKEKGGASDEKNYVSNEDDDNNKNSKKEDGKEEEKKEKEKGGASDEKNDVEKKQYLEGEQDKEFYQAIDAESRCAPSNGVDSRLESPTVSNGDNVSIRIASSSKTEDDGSLPALQRPGGDAGGELISSPSRSSSDAPKEETRLPLKERLEERVKKMRPLNKSRIKFGGLGAPRYQQERRKTEENEHSLPLIRFRHGQNSEPFGHVAGMGDTFTFLRNYSAHAQTEPRRPKWETCASADNSDAETEKSSRAGSRSPSRSGKHRKKRGGKRAQDDRGQTQDCSRRVEKLIGNLRDLRIQMGDVKRTFESITRPLEGCEVASVMQLEDPYRGGISQKKKDEILNALINDTGSIKDTLFGRRLSASTQINSTQLSMEHQMPYELVETLLKKCCKITDSETMPTSVEENVFIELVCKMPWAKKKDAVGAWGELGLRQDEKISLSDMLRWICKKYRNCWQKMTLGEVNAASRKLSRSRSIQGLSEAKPKEIEDFSPMYYDAFAINMNNRNSVFSKSALLAVSAQRFNIS